MINAVVDNESYVWEEALRRRHFFRKDTVKAFFGSADFLIFQNFLNFKNYFEKLLDISKITWYYKVVF